MSDLRTALVDAEQRHVALGHFNVSELAALKAVVAAAHELKVSVLVGVSEGEREFIGVRQVAALVASFRQQYGLPIFLNADHTHTLAKAEEAARAGFDEILFDSSSQPLERNIAQTRRAVEAIKSIHPSAIVEGEIGYIGAASEVVAQAPEGITLTTPAEATQFVAETRVDVLSPAVGNMHGMLQTMVRGEIQKRLDIQRIAAIKKAVPAFMTLHGGSGTNDDDLRQAIRAGVNIVHINTELRVAWRRGLEAGLAQNRDAVAPYKILPMAVQSVKEVVLARLRLFSFLDSAAHPAA